MGKTGDASSKTAKKLGSNPARFGGSFLEKPAKTRLNCLEYSERHLKILLAIRKIPNGKKKFGIAFGIFQTVSRKSVGLLEISKKCKKNGDTL